MLLLFFADPATTDLYTYCHTLYLHYALQIANEIIPCTGNIILDLAGAHHIKPHLTFIAQLKITLRPHFLLKGIHRKITDGPQIGPVTDLIYISSSLRIGSDLGPV